VLAAAGGRAVLLWLGLSGVAPPGLLGCLRFRLRRLAGTDVGHEPLEFVVVGEADHDAAAAFGALVHVDLGA